MFSDLYSNCFSKTIIEKSVIPQDLIKCLPSWSPHGTVSHSSWKARAFLTLCCYIWTPWMLLCMFSGKATPFSQDLLLFLVGKNQHPLTYMENILSYMSHSPWAPTGQGGKVTQLNHSVIYLKCSLIYISLIYISVAHFGQMRKINLTYSSFIIKLKKLSWCDGEDPKGNWLLGSTWGRCIMGVGLGRGLRLPSTAVITKWEVAIASKVILLSPHLTRGRSHLWERLDIIRTDRLMGGLILCQTRKVCFGMWNTRCPRPLPRHYHPYAHIK